MVLVELAELAEVVTEEAAEAAILRGKQTLEAAAVLRLVVEIVDQTAAPAS
jgi:hypothetical protein